MGYTIVAGCWRLFNTPPRFTQENDSAGWRIKFRSQQIIRAGIENVFGESSAAGDQEAADDVGPADAEACDS